VARLATASPDGLPHIVPVTFALVGEVVATAIDHKPKSQRPLRRIENIRLNSRVSLLADEYFEDWARLWWIRVDGRARLLDSGPDRDSAIDWLCAKYPQYRDQRPAGLVVWVDVLAIRGWSYAK